MSDDNRDRERTFEVDFLDFKRYFPFTPTALCIRECIRLSKLAGYPCAAPVLDVGCGDGLFARIAFRTAEVWGIDVDAVEGRWAQTSQAYSQIILGDVVNAWLPEDFFATCVANCSLEHIPDLDAALKQIHRALKPGGIAYLFVPTSDWAEYLRSATWAKRLRVGWLSKAITSGIDGVFRHYHLYDAQEWKDRSVKAGFEVLELSPIGTVGATQAFEAFLPASALGLLQKKLTGRWTLFPSLRGALAFPVYLMVQAALRSARDARPPAEYFLQLRKPGGDEG